MQKKYFYTSLKIAFVVGSILNIINSYDAIFQKEWDLKLIAKILLTYSVPFFVSLYSSWKAIGLK